MKAGLLIAVAAQLAAAQPQHRRHQHLHEKRNVVTEIDVVTATAPDVVVYVNQYGDPITTSAVNSYLHHKWHSSTSSHPSAVATSVSTAAVTSVVQTTSPAPVQTTSAAPVASSPTQTTASAPASSSSSGSSSSSSGLGVTYSPYNADGTCKSQSQVNADFAQLDGYSLVRMYGVDCNQLNTVGSAATAKGMKLFLGVYDINEVASEVSEIVAYAAGNWDNIHTVSIGNELINSGAASVSQVVAAVNTGRALLTAAGFTGNVVTVDTYVAVLNNPELCQCSDFAAINTHAFFNPDTTANEAGTFVSNVARQVQKACGKTTIVTESGWPSQGQANGVAVPSQQNQNTAVSSLKSAFSSNPSGLILFTAYNDFWKSNFQGSFEAEQYWGILGTSTA